MWLMHRASGRERGRLGTALGTPMPSSLWAGRGIGLSFCFGSLLESELGPSLRLQGARSSQLKGVQCFQGRCTQPEEDGQSITVSFSLPLRISFTERQSSGCPQYQHLQLCWDLTCLCITSLTHGKTKQFISTLILRKSLQQPLICTILCFLIPLLFIAQ